MNDVGFLKRYWYDKLLSPTRHICVRHCFQTVSRGRLTDKSDGGCVTNCCSKIHFGDAILKSLFGTKLVQKSDHKCFHVMGRNIIQKGQMWSLFDSFLVPKSDFRIAPKNDPSKCKNLRSILEFFARRQQQHRQARSDSIVKRIMHCGSLDTRLQNQISQ